ncbi:MAG: phospho-N-acetylmuramoyl-pentapeptide-transferase [Thermoleophilia bacterium]|nr:phospho-N-acetylmuramoyl-pentapeptide-transferase [Thermoleophilia bacterium]
MFQLLAAGLASMLITLFLGPKFIKFVKANEFGQQVREEGPEQHLKTKSGIPTFGGLLIIIGMLAPFIILWEWSVKSLIVIITTLGCGAIGFADDYAKIRMKRSLGLRARGKLLLQLLLAIFVGLIATRYGELTESIRIPMSDQVVDVGLFYYLIIFLWLAGFSNAVNLTDGLDGLAAGSVAVTMLTYMTIAFLTDQTDLGIIAACIGGACVGFLWFNSFPAEIFMGDTGSLALGGAIAALAFLTQTELLLIIIGAIFVAEAASVIIQVLTFKATHKRVRVFRMTPIHHHFELMAWSETKIIMRFWIVGAIFASTGFTIFYLSLPGR